MSQISGLSNNWWVSFCLALKLRYKRCPQTKETPPVLSPEMVCGVLTVGADYCCSSGETSRRQHPALLVLGPVVRASTRFKVRGVGKIRRKIAAVSNMGPHFLATTHICALVQRRVNNTTKTIQTNIAGRDGHESLQQCRQPSEVGRTTPPSQRPHPFFGDAGGSGPLLGIGEAAAGPEPSMF